MNRIAVLVLVAALWPATTMGQTTTGRTQSCGDMLRACSALTSSDKIAAEQLDAMYCLGYVRGSQDNDMAWRDAIAYMGISLPASICVPEMATTGQLARVFLKWLKENPEELHSHPAVCFTSALREAFPCESGPE